MSTIEIKTDERGCQMLLLTDEARFGAGARGLPVDNILVRVSDGYVFIKSPSSHGGLSRLSVVDVEMIEFYLREVDGPRAPNVFAGDVPPRG